MTIGAILLPVLASRKAQRPDYLITVDKASLTLEGKTLSYNATDNPRLYVVAGSAAFSGKAVTLSPNIDYSISVTKAPIAFSGKSVGAIGKIGVTATGLGFSGKNVSLSYSTTTETVLLTGTSGSPNVVYGTGTDPFLDAYAELKADADGTLYGKVSDGFSLGPYSAMWTNQWVDNPSYTDEYWIRATKVAGAYTPGGSLGSWMKLNTGDRAWWLTTNSAVKSCTLKLEISTDSGGSTIVATGYYQLYVEMTL